jgi:hypothetical protein
MMWFQRHEEPKTITEEYEQVIFNWSHFNWRDVAFNLVFLIDKGHLYLLWLREVGPEEKGGLHVRVQISRRSRSQLA